MSLESKTIAIVDDDASVRRSLRRLVRAAGYRVEVFASACELLESGDPGRADCLLLDIRMPVMDGITLCEQLRKRNVKRPVIFITAHHDGAEQLRAHRAGARCVLPKPVQETQLLDALRDAVPDLDER